MRTKDCSHAFFLIGGLALAGATAIVAPPSAQAVDHQECRTAGTEIGGLVGEQYCRSLRNAPVHTAAHPARNAGASYCDAHFGDACREAFFERIEGASGCADLLDDRNLWDAAQRRAALVCKPVVDVRGECAVDSGRFMTVSGGCFDTDQGLFVSGAASRRLDFEGARRYCRSLEAGGVFHWRLPSLQELSRLGGREFIDHFPVPAAASDPDASGDRWTFLTSSRTGRQAHVVTLRCDERSLLANGRCGERLADLEGRYNVLCVSPYATERSTHQRRRP